ncbi:MAG: hypothetical protein K8T90_21380 [Planctomycetes bacterium]|nr:hypothetical protein [Planctomycetota bacterium]
MRRSMRFFALAALAALAVPALALAGDGIDGFTCDHVCPLAREANGHRSAGAEAVTKAPSVRATLAASVARNLRKV